MKEKPKLISGKFDCNFTHAAARAEWEAIASTLNSIPGCQKNWKMWRSTWQHIRSRTKQKQAQVLRNRRATGGGPEAVLGEVDENILSIIKPVMVEGHKIAEPSVSDIIVPCTSSSENINQDDPIEQEPERRPIRNIPQRPHLRVKKSGEAVDADKQSLDKKNDIKEAYYKKKIAILESNAESTARMADAMVQMAESLEDISKTFNTLLENLL